MGKFEHIGVKKDIKDQLDKLKIHKNQSYNEVIAELIIKAS